MSGREILDAFNSATTFFVLIALIVSVWILIAKKEKSIRSKPSKR